MAGTLKSLLVKLGVDNKAFDKGIDNAEKKSRNLEKTFAGLTKVGMGITMGIAAGIGATAVALATTIQPASDLEESINAVNVVFGEGADEILKYGENASMTVGLSNRAFGQMSAEMGAMLGNVGIAEDKLAGETINLMERASDMASIFNTDVSQSFAAIQSAIKGEFNPLEQFGVKMNQAMINAKALSMGLVDVTQNATEMKDANVRLQKAQDELNQLILYGADTSSVKFIEAQVKVEKALAKVEDAMAGNVGPISDAAKAQAALALVYEQTDKVAGDFQNTSDGLANSQRQLAGILEDTKAKIGAGLTPALGEIAVLFKEIAASPEFEAFLDKILVGVGKLAEWISVKVPLGIKNFKKMVDFFKNNKAVVVGVLAAMSVAVLAFGVSVATAAWAALVPMLPVIAVLMAVAGIAYLVYEAWTTNWNGIQEKTAATWAWIVNAFQQLKNMVLAIWDTIWKVIGPIFDAFRSAFEGDWHAFGENIRKAWVALWTLVANALYNAVGLLAEVVLGLVTKVRLWFESVDWGEVGLNIIKGIANGIAGAANLIKNAAVNAAKAAWEAAKGFLGIESPSTLFAGIGENMMMGMAGGIDQGASVPVSTTQAVTADIATTAGQTAGNAQPQQSQPILDEAILARMLRDAILQVMD